MTFYYVCLEKRSYTRKDTQLHTLISYVLLVLPMAILTKWEADHLTAINLLLTNAKTAMEKLEKKESDIPSSESEDTSEDWITFRDMMLNLYSVLDYTYFLVYCHFSNKGQVDLTPDARHLGFPYKPKGVKVQVNNNGEVVYGEHDERKSFVKEKMEILLSKNLQLAEETHFWKEIGDTILGVQPMKMVDDAGRVLELKDDVNPKIAAGDAESFAMLHFFRNCCAHRDLIRFDSKEATARINLQTNRADIVRQYQEQEEGYHFLKCGRVYWIMLPETVAKKGNGEWLLLVVMKQLLEFVTNVCSKLIHASLLLPSATSIIQCHIRGHEIGFKFTTANAQHKTIVTLMDGRQKVETLSSAYHNSKVDATEEVCVHFLEQLAKRGIFPERPYAFFKPQYIQPYPPVQTVEVREGNTRTLPQLVSQCIQRLNSINLTMQHSCDHIKVDRVYRAQATLSIKSTAGDVILVKLQSSNHEVEGKDNAIKAAYKELEQECLRLGFIRIRYRPVDV